MAFDRFIRAAMACRAIEVFGSGEQVRDFTFVDDVVDANLRAAVGDVAPGSVFNVSGGTSISINQVLDELAGIAGHHLDVHRTATVPGDVRRTGGSAERIRTALGWCPKVGIAAGLRAQWRSLAMSSTQARIVPPRQGPAVEWRSDAVSERDAPLTGAEARIPW
jgi:nucleoside-diphosphate-sugar epimerase